MSRHRHRSPTPERVETAPTSTSPTTPARVMTPGVNLLSPWVLEQLHVHALRKRFAYGLAAVVLVVLGAWGGQQLRLAEARADLRGEVAVGDGLRSRIDGLAPVATYVGEVQRRAQTVRDTMWTQTSQADALLALRAAVPQGTVLDNVAFTSPTPGEVPLESGAVSPSALEPGETRGLVITCPGPDPFAARAVVACVQLEGTAPDRQSVSSLVRALGSDPLFVEPFVNTTTTMEGRVTFSGSVGLSPETFTGRYDDVAPAAPDQEQSR